MATIRLVPPEIWYYRSIAEFRAYVDDLELEEYVDFYFSVSRPNSIREIYKTPLSGRYIFEVLYALNMHVNVMAIIYKFDMNMNKIVQEVLEVSEYMYDNFRTSNFDFDIPPEPSIYDEVEGYNDDLQLIPMTVDLWYPQDHLFELPYYYPVIVTPKNGLPPYEYTWEVRRLDKLEETPSYYLFYMSGTGNFVFYKEGYYEIKSIVKDQTGNVVIKNVYLSLEQDNVTTNTDFQVVNRIQQWKDPQYILIKENNYYYGKYPIKIDLSLKNITISDIAMEVKYLLSNQITMKQMWERFYISKGKSFYASSSRVAIYKSGKVALNNLYLDENNYIYFNFKLLSDYSLNTCNARILQALRWVLIINDIPFEIDDVDTTYEYALISNNDGVLNDMTEYMKEALKTIYFRLELDEIFESVQMDVDMFLNRNHEYVSEEKYAKPFIN